MTDQPSKEYTAPVSVLRLQSLREFDGSGSKSETDCSDSNIFKTTYKRGESEKSYSETSDKDVRSSTKIRSITGAVDFPIQVTDPSQAFNASKNGDLKNNQLYKLADGYYLFEASIDRLSGSKNLIAKSGVVGNHMHVKAGTVGEKILLYGSEEEIHGSFAGNTRLTPIRDYDSIESEAESFDPNNPPCISLKTGDIVVVDFDVESGGDVVSLPNSFTSPTLDLDRSLGKRVNAVSVKISENAFIGGSCEVLKSHKPKPKKRKKTSKTKRRKRKALESGSSKNPFGGGLTSHNDLLNGKL